MLSCVAILYYFDCKGYVMSRAALADDRKLYKWDLKIGPNDETAHTAAGKIYFSQDSMQTCKNLSVASRGFKQVSHSQVLIIK